MAVKFLNNINVSGEVEGTSLDINGNADISGNLAVGGDLTVTNNGYGLKLQSDDGSDYIRMRADGSDAFIEADGQNFLIIDGAAMGVKVLSQTSGSARLIIGSDPQSIRTSGGSLQFWTSSAKRLEVDSSGHLLPHTDSTFNLGSTSAYFANAYIDALTTTGKIQCGGELEGTSLDINGNADISGTSSFGGKMTITSTSDSKLNLRVSAGDSNDWNYIDFTGSDGTRDSFIGVDSDGDPQWYRDNNGIYLRLDSDQIYASSKLKVNGEVEATLLDINGNADISGTLNIGTLTGTTNFDGLLTWTGTDYAAAINLSEGNVTNVNQIEAYEFSQRATGEPRNNLGTPTVTEMALFEQQF